MPKIPWPLFFPDTVYMATLYRLRLVDELAGPSGNMGFGWGKQRNKQRNNVDTVPLYSPGLIIKFAFSPVPD